MSSVTSHQPVLMLIHGDSRRMVRHVQNTGRTSDELSALLDDLEHKQTLLILEVAEIGAEEDALLERLDELHGRLDELSRALIQNEGAIEVTRRLLDPKEREQAVRRAGARQRELPNDPTGRLALILRLMETNPDKGWSAKELFEKLESAGSAPPTLHALRAQLSRWARHGALAKAERGGYAVPARSRASDR